MKNIFFINTKKERINKKRKTTDNSVKELTMKLSKDYIDGKIEMSEMKNILIKKCGTICM